LRGLFDNEAKVSSKNRFIKQNLHLGYGFKTIVMFCVNQQLDGNTYVLDQAILETGIMPLKLSRG
jgi:hypothetical protein